jgi:hypothetical protein
MQTSKTPFLNEKKRVSGLSCNQPLASELEVSASY